MNRNKKLQMQDGSATHGWAILLAMGFVPVIALMSKLYPQHTVTWRTLILATAFLSIALLCAYWGRSPQPEQSASDESNEDADLLS